MEGRNGPRGPIPTRGRVVRLVGAPVPKEETVETVIRRTRGLACAAWCILALGAVRAAEGQTTEFRAFWADAFHEGFKSASEIDAMVSRAVAGRYNAIVAEVMASQDDLGNSHGAYWNSSIVPKAPDISGGIDPLAYLVQRAHASGLEVHAWLVAYRIGSTWPPHGNSTLTAHPEYVMVPQGSMGLMAKVGSDYVLDPGSPDVQEYLVSIVRELVTNYAIDGIHWDYIRYTQTDAGYPSSLSYARSGLARFKRISGYPGTPPATGYTPWDDFRRREVTELVRRTRAEIASVAGNPRQPLRHSAALITWGDAPASFSASSAWARFQNWEEWMRLGFLDMGIPMTYYDETVYPTWYRNWVAREMGWRYQRYMVVGPAIYLNTFANSIAQMRYARDAGADGLCTYSYYATKSPSTNDWGWYGHVASNLFTTAAATPAMPWRRPETAAEGTLWGRVTDGYTGLPIDDASVQVGSASPVKTDGNGYYVATMVPAAGAGTPYPVTASKTGYTPVSHTNVIVRPGDVVRDDLAFNGTPPPTITEHPQSQGVCPGTTAFLSVTATGEGTLFYAWEKNGAAMSDGGHYSGCATSTLAVSNFDAGDAAPYRCVVRNAGGSTTSGTAALSLGTTTITQQPQPKMVPAGGTATFSVGATGRAPLTYQWQKNAVNLDEAGHYAGTTTATLTVSAADEDDVASYRCVVTGGCDTATSGEAVLALEGSGPEHVVESREGGRNHDSYSEIGTLTSSNSKSTAAGTTAGIGSRWAYMNRSVYGINKAVYGFTPTITGMYQVFATWPASSNASSHVEHIVTHAGGSATVALDQDRNTNPGGANNWNLLGQYRLAADTAYTVTQTNENYSDSEVFRADAVKWVLISVLPPPPAITQQPQPAHVRSGAAAAFTVSATGEGVLTYRWLRDGTDLTDDARVSGAGTSSLTISDAERADEGMYRCRVSNAGGDTMSDEAALAVHGAGDLDLDGDVDLSDLSRFQACFNGPNQTPANADCADADLDGDGDVDLADFTTFNACYNGPNNPPACR